MIIPNWVQNYFLKEILKTPLVVHGHWTKPSHMVPNDFWLDDNKQQEWLISADRILYHK